MTTARDRGWLLALVAVAGAVRVLVCALSFDVPGDGPSRAIAVWEWLQAPHLVTWGFWPPGVTYLAGIVGVVLPDPRWSVRIVNVLVGTATVPIFLAVARRVVPGEAAWLAAALLAVLPLHVELSATSLTEASFVGEMLVACWLAMAAGRALPWQWAGGLLAILWAVMTRYEAWWFAPLLIVAVATSGHWWGAVGVAVASLAFPIAWTLGNTRVMGNPFYGFTMARLGAELAGTPPLGLVAALGLLARKTTDALGWLLVVGALVGTVLAVGRAWRGGTREIRRDGMVYGAMLATFWAAMTWFAMQRGESVLDRYLLLGVVLLLPVAALAWCRLGRDRPRVLVAVGLVLAVSTMMPRLGQWPPATTWLTWSAPRDAEALAAWLRASPHRDATFVFTECGWRSTYVTLYWPEVAARRLIVSPWTSDDELRQFLRRRPSVLVTTASDVALQRRIEHTGGLTIGPPLATFDALEVRTLEQVAEKGPSASSIGRSLAVPSKG